MKRFIHRILSVVLTLVLLVTMVTIAIVPAQAGLIANLLTQNYTAIAVGAIERVTTTAISKAASAAEDETLSEVLNWTSRIVSGYQSVVNKTLIAKTEEISDQLDDMYSLETEQFAAINKKLNQIIQEDAADDFADLRAVVTDAGDKYQNIIGTFDDYYECFVNYNNDPTDENKKKLSDSYSNLCIDYKYVLNANSKDVFEEETFIKPMTEGGFLKTLSPYNYNIDVYVDDVPNIKDPAIWGTADQRETYLDALFNYSSSVYNFENNVYDVMAAGLNEAADAVSMYVRAYRYYVDFNIELINNDAELDEATKSTLISRLEEHFNEYTLKAIRALNQMCEEHKEVFTTYMRSYDTTNTVYVKDYQSETTYGEAYPNGELGSDMTWRPLNTTYSQDRSTMDVYQFKLVNESDNNVYAIKHTVGNDSSARSYFPVKYASSTLTNKGGAFSLDVFNFANGTTNGLHCITSLSEIKNIYDDITAYNSKDTLINNIKRELGVHHSSVELESVNETDANIAAGAYLLLDTEILWRFDVIVDKNLYADMIWADVSKVNPIQVTVDSKTDVKEGSCKDSQLNVMYKGTPSVSLGVNTITDNSGANGTSEVYISDKCVISNSGSAKGLTSSTPMTFKVTPDEDTYVSSVVLKNQYGHTMYTLFEGQQDDYFSMFGNEAAEFCIPVPCQDAVIEVTYKNVIDEYNVSISNTDDFVTVLFDDEDKNQENNNEIQAVFNELETVKINVLPEEGYFIGIVRIADEFGNGIDVKITDIESATGVRNAKQYSFTMPEADVTFSAGSYEDLGGDFFIHNYEELCQMRDDVNNKKQLYIAGQDRYVSASEARYLILNDIVCTEGDEWIPVSEFGGNLDGGGHTISGIRFSGEDTTVETFGFIDFLNENGTVKNLHLEDAVVEMGLTELSAALLVFENAGAIRNCSVQGSINLDIEAFSEDSSISAGGLVCGNMGYIEDCQSDCDITIGSNICLANAGGLVSTNLNTGRISDCSTTGDITCLSMLNVIGGICAINTGYVERTFNTGDIISHGYVQCGGLCGFHYVGFISKDIYFSDCYTTGDITINEYENDNADAYALWTEYLKNSPEEDVCVLGMLFGNVNAPNKNGYSTGVVIGEEGRVYDAVGKSTDSYVPENSYVMVDDSVERTEASYKYMSQFNSGEVAYLLNSGATDGSQVWYQNIDNGLTPDDSPNFSKNGINTVYALESDAGYTNLLEAGNESKLDASDLRTYQRIIEADGTFSENSQIAYGYGIIDHNNSEITVFMADTAERMGVLMHQGLDGKSGVLRLQGDYPRFEETSAELLAAGVEEPLIYVDGNGCIFITNPEDGSALPELTVEYTQKPVGEYTPTLYNLKVEIIDAEKFQNAGSLITGSFGSVLGGTVTDTLDKNDPDHSVIEDEKLYFAEDTDKDAESTADSAATDKDVVDTGFAFAGVALLALAIVGGYMVVVLRKKRFSK